MADTPAARRAILVLGMHRSGTSAFSRVLSLLGATGPSQPMQPGPDNPRGFWEPERIARLNDALLAAGGSSWADWTRFDPARVPDALRPAFEARMEAALWAEFGEAALFVLKDPRMSRLLPLWRPALERIGAAPSAVIALRHPAAVLRSLAARNGMSPEHALLAWLRHVLDAERSTRDMPRAFAAYDALLADWRGVAAAIGARLGLSWPVPDGTAAQEIEQFLDADLRHGGAEEIGFSSAYAEVWTRHSWAALETLARSGDDPGALGALERVRAQFEDACRLFAPAPLPAPAVLRRDLRDVTLCAADSRSVALTARALRRSLGACGFADAVLFSDHDASGPFRARRVAPIVSRDAYSAFVLRDLAADIATSHALLVQWDGWVTGPAAWDDAFLDYDYVGAVWGRYADGMDVGNGGFSLRSRRLLQALQDGRFAPVPGAPEDELIGRTWRPTLEREHGIRFAPPALAARFSYERVLPEAPTFGFHGLFNFWRHLDDGEMDEIAAELPTDAVRGLEFAQLVAMCFLQRRAGALRPLGARWLAAQPSAEIAAALRRVLRDPTAAGDCLRLLEAAA